jgi:uncharacterized Rmd1/YagE family protein
LVAAGTAESTRTIVARACCVGTRIETRELEQAGALAQAPLVLRAGARGCVVVFRFGAYVSFDLDPAEEAALAERLAPHVVAPLPQPETESAELALLPGRPERVDAGGRIVVATASHDRLQVVASVLAKSTVLAHHEEEVAHVFDRVDSLAERLRRGARLARGRELARQIGDVLLTQSRMVGRAEVSEKPEITWEDPALDRLYERLAAEYELSERDRALSRKLELIGLTARTVLDLVNERQGLRLEWYIVILIAIEIVLIVYDILERST